MIRSIYLRAAVVCTSLVAPLLSTAEPAINDMHVEVLADGFDTPWGLALLPDGRMLVTERSGQLHLLDAQGQRVTAIKNVPEAFAKLQGGLLDVALHPNFERNATIYLSLAHGHQKHNTTRVVRAVLQGDALVDAKVIFDNTPKGTSVHYGGRLAFMPDGTLLVTTGEGADYREDAQRLDSLLGKIVRLNDDGSVPSDNPFVNTPGAHPAIWSYGHRNPQGLFVDTSGTVYAAEHGPRGGDEVNIIEPKTNYGWPIATHGIDYTGGRISPFETYDGMKEPLLYWTPSIGPGGIAMYRGAMFPEWEGDLFVAVLGHKHLRRIDLDEGKVVAQEILLEDLQGRFRQVEVGVEGALYAVVESVGERPNSGRILKITRQPSRQSADDSSHLSMRADAP